MSKGLRIWIVVLLAVSAATSANRTYTRAKLSEAFAKDIYVTAGIPPLTQNGSALNLPVPLGVMYQFYLDADGITYVAGCMSKAKKSYLAEWVINGAVEFRVEKDKLFLERPGGKELRLGLLTRVRDTPEAVDSSSTSSSTSLAIAAHQNIPECR